MLFLIPSTTAALVFSSQWVKGDCQGPPTSMSIFDLKSEPVNSFYEFVSDEYSMGVCGNLVAPKSKGCCYSSLNVTASQGIQSGSFHEVEPRQASNAPITANDQFYCSLSGLNTTIGPDSIWVLGTDSCIEKHYVCSKDAIQVFPDPDCQGRPERFPLTNQVQTISTARGRMNAQYSVFQGGAVQYSWTAFTPSSVLVPRFQIAGDFLGTGMFALACLGATGTVLYFIKKYMEKQTKYMKFFLISQIMWLVWVVAKTAYYYLLFDTNEQFMIYSEIMNILFNFSTISTVLNSAAFLIKFQHVTSKLYCVVFYSCLVILHLVMSGALYFDYFRFTGPYMDLIKTWNKFAIAWIVFMFLFNMLPSFFVTSALLKFQDQDSTLSQRFLNLHHVDPRFSRLALSQFLVIVGYATCATLKNTEALGNDRNFLGMDGFLAFFLVWHSILNCLFIQNVAVIAQLKSRMKSSNEKSFSNRSVFSQEGGR